MDSLMNRNFNDSCRAELLQKTRSQLRLLAMPLHFLLFLELISSLDFYRLIATCDMRFQVNYKWELTFSQGDTKHRDDYKELSNVLERDTLVYVTNGRVNISLYEEILLLKFQMMQMETSFLPQKLISRVTWNIILHTRFCRWMRVLIGHWRWWTSRTDQLVKKEGPRNGVGDLCRVHFHFFQPPPSTPVDGFPFTFACHESSVSSLRSRAVSNQGNHKNDDFAAGEGYNS